MANKIRLVIHGGATPRKEYAIEGTTTIGRGDDCTIKIDDLSISRKHCQIELREGVFYFKDLGSTNGIHHNESKKALGDLAHGDRLRIGDVDFDVAEGSRPVVERTDDYLEHRKQKKPKKKLSKAQRFRRLLIATLIVGLLVLGAAGYQAYVYKRDKATIAFALGEKPFVSQEQGFQLRVPPEKDGWEYIQDIQKTARRNWQEKPPVLGNGKIMGNELFDDYHIHVWMKRFPDYSDTTCFLLVEVLEGVSREKDILGYSISRTDLPKYYNLVKHLKEIPDILPNVPWAAGERGEQALGFFEPAPGLKVKAVERGYVANGNRYLVMALARENFFERSKVSIKEVLESFKCVLPQTEIAIMTQSEFKSEADKYYRIGTRLMLNKNNPRKLYEAFENFRNAVLLYKKLNEEPFEASEAMKNLKEAQELLEVQFVELRNKTRINAKRGAWDVCTDACDLILSIVTDDTEEWSRWAKQSRTEFQIRKFEALR